MTSLFRLLALIRDVLSRGTSFVIAGNVLVNLARIVSTVVLTRLLTAEDFGVVGIISSILYIVVMLSDVGVQAYIVRHDEGAQTQFLDEVWTLRLIRGIVIAAVIGLLSGPITALFGKPHLQLVIAVSGAYLAIEAWSSLAFATAARSGIIRRLTLLDVVPQLLSIPISIALAFWLMSYWAIIASMFFVAAIKIILSYAIFPNASRRFRPSAARVRDLWTFGRYLTGSSMIQILLSQTDKVVLARLIPLGQFGLYSLATNLGQVPVQLTANYSSRILYPLFARTQREDSAQFADVYYGAGRPLRLLYMVGAGGFIACAPFIVKLLYDNRYLGAAIYLQLLAITALFALPVSIASDALIAVGGVRHLLYLNLAKVAWLAVAALGLFALYGAIGIVIAIVSMQAVGQVYCWWALRRASVLRPIREVPFAIAAALGYSVGLMINGLGTRLVT